MRPESNSHSVSSIVQHFIKNPFPTELYPSTIGIYGAEIATTPEGKMIYKIGSKLSDKIDVVGDAFLRIFDDHVVKEPLKMFLRHPGVFLNFVFKSEPMRRRGSRDEILQNIERLGLTEFYGPALGGIEIKKPEVFTQSVALGDIYEAKRINSPILEDIDRFQALSVASSYIGRVHQDYGPIGDIVGDILFQQKEGSKVINPVLNIPDVVLNPSKRRTKYMRESFSQTGLSSQEIDTKIKNIFSQEQKAVDICELMISCAFCEFKLSDNPELVERTIQTIAQNYPDKEVLKIAKAFIKRGRHTLPGNKNGGILKNFFTLHNSIHLDATKENAEAVRQIIDITLTNHFDSLSQQKN